jgi:hypothetical protein
MNMKYQCNVGWFALFIEVFLFVIGMVRKDAQAGEAIEFDIRQGFAVPNPSGLR